MSRKVDRAQVDRALEDISLMMSGLIVAIRARMNKMGNPRLAEIIEMTDQIRTICDQGAEGTPVEFRQRIKRARQIIQSILDIDRASRDRRDDSTDPWASP